MRFLEGYKISHIGEVADQLYGWYNTILENGITKIECHGTKRVIKIGLIFALLAIGLPSLGKAQILNVEQLRGEADSTGWGGMVGVDVSVEKYRDRVIKVENSSGVYYTSQKHNYILLSNLEFVNVDDESVINSGHFHFRSTFWNRSHLSPEVFVQYQYNNNLGLNNRVLAGAGVRYRILDDGPVSATFSTGLMSETERWKPREGDIVEQTFIKSTSNLALRGQITEDASLLLIGYYQARPAHFFKPRATLESQFRVRLGRFASLGISFSMTHDSIPVIDIPKLTYELKNGLIFTF